MELWIRGNFGMEKTPRSGLKSPYWLLVIPMEPPCINYTWDLHEGTIAHSMNITTSLQSKQRYYAFENYNTHAIFQIRN